MRQGRFARTLGVAGLMAIIALPVLAPVTSSADTTPTPSGAAKAAALQVTLSPQALVNIALPPALTSLLATLPCNVGTVAGNALTSTTTVSLDASSNAGTLNSGATDFVSGQATSEALGVDLAGINDLVSGIENVLNGDFSCLTGGTSTGLPVDVQSLLAPLTSALQGITKPLLGSISAAININKTLQVSLDQNPLTADLLDLNTPLGDLNLGPYDAVAVSQAGAQKYNISTGPQLEAHNSTTNINVGASLPLGSVSQLGNISGLLTNLEKTVAGDLNSVTGQLGLLGGGAAPTGAVITTVCNTLGGLLGSTGLNCTALAANPATGAQTLLPQLTSLQGSLQGLTTGLPLLQNVLGALPSSINLLGLIQTGGETSSVLTQPQNGGVHSIATTVLPDLKVLQVAGLSAPLLEVKGFSSSSEAFVNGTDTTPPKGTVSFLEVDILGHGIALPGLGTSQTITVPTPLGDITVVISIGVPQTINNTASRKTESASALHIALINGDASGANPITLLGGKGGSILDVLIAGTQVDDAMTAVAATPQTQVQATSTTLPPTGMLGPIGFAGVGLLGLAAAGLRFASRRSRKVIDAEPPVDVDID